jgi:7-carboxy-7-deazaguanine synthase
MKVVEKFVSINGEGRLAGQLAVFIRFKSCNLNCSYCDTKWANTTDAPYTEMSPSEIYDYIKSTGVKNVTLTGGEPLLQKDIHSLLELLCNDDFIRTEIETNGSVDVSPFSDFENRPSFTLDYKLPSSNMSEYMLTKNYEYIDNRDSVKFVSGSIEDLQKAKEIIYKYNLSEKTNVFISPVFGNIELPQIVDFMIENNMNDVKMQLQMHKVIWDAETRGV